jgi:hypothetical protein
MVYTLHTLHCDTYIGIVGESATMGTMAECTLPDSDQYSF